MYICIYTYMFVINCAVGASARADFIEYAQSTYYEFSY